MVLCNYFISGHCRFGSKCMNDHIDLKALLKTEIESAINGRQWLLSCFGPFKESTVIPNLMDRSFEEVRLDFMEASKNGTTQQHVSELIGQYNDSMAKLNQLKMANPDTIQLVANIYNQSVQEQKATQEVAPASSNVFAISNSAVTSPQPQPNPFQLSNVFGGAQMNQTAPMNAGNIFGGTPANSNPFQAAAQNSIFGGPKEQPPVAASAFTFSLGQQAPQQSVFGSTQQQSPQSSIFGSTHQQSPQSSIFGSSQPVQLPQQPPTASIFGGQKSTFGGAPIFSAPALQQQPQQLQPSSVFGSSIFAQSQPAPGIAGPGIFGSPLQSSLQSQPFQQQQPLQPGNVFGGFLTQPILPDPQVQPTGNIFAQAATAQPQNVFAIQQTVPTQLPQTSAPTSIFQIQQPTTNQQQNFGANPFQTQPAPPTDESVYSKPEDLTPDDMLAFQADTFHLGSIPIKPPPRHLCT